MPSQSNYRKKRKTHKRRKSQKGGDLWTNIKGKWKGRNNVAAAGAATAPLAAPLLAPPPAGRDATTAPATETLLEAEEILTQKIQKDMMMMLDMYYRIAEVAGGWDSMPAREKDRYCNHFCSCTLKDLRKKLIKMEGPIHFDETEFGAFKRMMNEKKPAAAAAAQDDPGGGADNPVPARLPDNPVQDWMHDGGGGKSTRRKSTRKKLSRRKSFKRKSLRRKSTKRRRKIYKR
jgi:hypothetical protein